MFFNHLSNRTIRNLFPPLLYLFLLSCGQEQPQFNTLSRDAVIVAFGDSLTYGTGAKPAESFPVILEQLSNRKVINAGIPGELSGSGLDRFPEVLDKHQPELVILCHGGNDILRKKNLAETENNLKKMIALAQSRNIKLILLGVPKPGIFLETASFYENIATEHGVMFVKDLIADILSDADFKSDHVHPNNKGYRQIADRLYLLLKESGAL